MPISPDVTVNNIVFFRPWWRGKFSKGQPPPNISPVMLSILIDKRFQDIIMKSPERIAFQKSKEPVGAHDLSTKNFIE